MANSRTASAKPLTPLPDELAGAMVDAAEAFQKIKSYLAEAGDEKVDIVYTSLRSLVWNFVASRESGSHLDLWADAILRVRQLLRARGAAGTERFTVLSDMLEQSARFPVYNRKSELKTKKHVVDILKVLAANAGTSDRAAIIRKTKLREANLSRVLANLAAAGWVSRTLNGREVTVSLTAEGWSQAEEVAAPTTQESTKKILSDEFSSDLIRELWPASACALAISDDRHGTFQYGENFLAMVGGAHQTSGLATDGPPTSTTAAGEPAAEAAAREIPTGDGRFVQIIEQHGNGRSLWLAWDVTPYRIKIEDYRRRERLLLSQIAELRRAAGSRTSVRPVMTHTGDASAMRTMLTMLRHNLLTPASLIESTARAIMAGVKGPVGPGYTEYLMGIVTESSKLQGLLKNIVNIGEIWDSAGSQDAFVPDILVTDVVGHLQAAGHGVKVNTHTAGNRNEVMSNERALRSAVFQCVSGMVELTPFGEEVDVVTKTLEDGIEVEVRGGAADCDIAFITPSTHTFAMCSGTVQHFGGKFSFGGSASEGCTAKIFWPAVAYDRY